MVSAWGRVMVKPLVHLGDELRLNPSPNWIQ